MSISFDTYEITLVDRLGFLITPYNCPAAPKGPCDTIGCHAPGRYPELNYMYKHAKSLSRMYQCSRNPYIVYKLFIKEYSIVNGCSNFFYFAYLIWRRFLCM